MALSNRNSQTKQPRLCRICPDRPPKAGCLCSKTRRDAKTHIGPNATESLLPPTEPGVRPQHPEPSQSMELEHPILDYTSFFSALAASQSIATAPMHPKTLTSISTTSQPSPFLPLPTTTTPSLSLEPSSMPPPPADASIHGPSVLESEEAIANEPDTSESDSDSETPQRPRRIRPTKKNPIFGLVDGVTVNKYEYAIVRPRALRQKEGSNHTPATANKRFTTEIADILSRCERLAMETGAWIVIGASQPYPIQRIYTYASPRIRTDNLQEGNNLIKKIWQFLRLLGMSKYVHAQEICTKLHNVTEELETAKSLILEEKQNSQKIREELDMYKARFGSV